MKRWTSLFLKLVLLFLSMTHEISPAWPPPLLFVVPTADKTKRLILEKARANVFRYEFSTLLFSRNRHCIMSAGYQGGQKVQKVMVQPINLIFRFLQNRERVLCWLYENVNTRIEGHIVGFDEFMNLVMDDAAEVHLKKRTRKEIGRIMLKGDNISLIQSADPK